MGCPRTGTTYLTSIVQRMGAMLPAGATPECHLEPEEFYKEDVTQWIEVDSDRMRRFFENLSYPAVVKYPTLSFYWDIVGDIAAKADITVKPIICIRNPIETGLSWINIGTRSDNSSRIDLMAQSFVFEQEAALAALSRWPEALIVHFASLYEGSRPSHIENLLAKYLSSDPALHHAEMPADLQPIHCLVPIRATLRFFMFHHLQSLKFDS